MRDDGDDGYQAAAHELQLEREQCVLTALMECKRAGSKLSDLEILARELGLRRAWEKYQQATRP